MLPLRKSIVYSISTCVVLIFGQVVVAYSADCKQKNKEKKDDTYDIDRFVFDVTKMIHQNKNLNEIEELPCNVNPGTEQPVVYYYKLFDDNICHFIWRLNGDFRTLKKLFTCDDAKHIVGLSILFSNPPDQLNVTGLLNFVHGRLTSTTVLNLLTENSFIESVILEVKAYEYTVQCNEVSKAVPKYLKKFLGINDPTNNTKRVKLGIKYDEKFMKSCSDELYEIFEYMDHAVLFIDTPKLTDILLYNNFYELINNLITENRQFVEKLNPKSSILVEVNSKNVWVYSIIETVKDYSEELVLNHLKAFVSEGGGNETFILSPALTLPSTKQYLKEHVTAITSMNFANFINDNNLAIDKEDVDMSFLSSVYSNIMLFSNTEDLPKPQRMKLPLASSYFIASHSPRPNNLNSSTEKNNTLQLHTAYISPEKIGWNETNELFDANHVRKGCLYFGALDVEAISEKEPRSKFIQDMSMECTEKNLTTDILHMQIWGSNEMQNLDKLLPMTQQIKDEFEAEFPERKYIPAVYLEIPDATDDDTFYCNPTLKQTDNYYQAILFFAKYRKWDNLVLFPPHNILHTSSSKWVGHYQKVSTDNTLNHSIIQFPIYYRTNTAKSPDISPLPMIYPCIERTLNPQRSGINFLKNMYSGVTFEIFLKQHTMLTAKELQTLTAFALDRFSSIEITAVNASHASLLEGLMPTKLLESVTNIRQINEIDSPLCYVEIPLTFSKALQKPISKLSTQSYTAVHFGGWESLLPHQWKDGSIYNFDQIKEISPSKVNLGLTIQSCSHEIHTKLARLKNLPILKFLTYVVCNVKPIPPNSQDKGQVELFFGTLLYTKSYLEQHLSAMTQITDMVEVMFRINLDSNAQQCSWDWFLLLANDLNQYSAAYNIRYFVVRAFEEEDSSNKCLQSWFRVKNYTDLTDQSIYIDKENDYFDRPTKLRIKIPDEDEAEDSNIEFNSVYIYTLLPLFIIFFLLMFVMGVRHRRIHKRFLSLKEVNEFYNGTDLKSDDMMMTDVNSADTMYMKFHNNYEIPEKDIDLGAIIGSGQFGLVYKGVVRKEIDVAIKVPRSDCGTDQFKSTLSELKLHCYIGTHPNVVTLVGAHTKKIAEGKLYIVIEHCGNGSLQSFLRKGKKPVSDEREDDVVDINLMYTFAHQIASGMAYLAEKRVIHGDLATRNVLLTSDLTCKIADFGLSRRLYEMSEYKKTSKEPLPWRWMALESLQKMEFTTKTDVWSYGITIWEIFSHGMTPYPGRSWTEEFVTDLENGMRISKAKHASAEINAKMAQCWNLNPEERPTFTELVLFFTEYKDNEYLSLNE